VGLDEEQSLQNKGKYTRLICHSHFGCYWLHTETWKSPQTNNIWSS